MITQADIEKFLAEDVPHGDLTTTALGIGAKPGRMVFRARQPMVVSAAGDAARILTLAGAQVSGVVEEGAVLEKDAPILEATGSAAALLQGWKVAQTLVEAASGIASAARIVVDAARAVNPAVVVACTRKAFPGTRAVAVQAIQAGGAVPHRLGLSETVLVFPEHRMFLDQDLGAALAHLRAACPEKKVVVEVGSIEDAEQAALSGADVIQLEKFAPDLVARTVARLAELAPPAKVAAAGGINGGNAADYARAGAHVLVTSWPYQAAPRDVAVTILARD